MTYKHTHIQIKLLGNLEQFTYVHCTLFLYLNLGEKGVEFDKI